MKSVDKAVEPASDETSATQAGVEDTAPVSLNAVALNPARIKNIVEAALMAAGQPLSLDRLLSLFLDENQPTRDELRTALKSLAEDCAERGVELVEVGSGFRYQSKQENAPWIARLWEEKPPRYSRALLETLALIAYRQPITRGEIEDIRGVSVSTNIMKTLLERDWVKVVGHRDVPGKPAMYATTRQFLDYFSLKSLSDLPTLAEIRDIDSINAELDLAEPGAQGAGTGTEQAEDAAATENTATEEISAVAGEAPDEDTATEPADEDETVAAAEADLTEDLEAAAQDTPASTAAVTAEPA
ncbi:MAG TPA: SMC-Scp complex subunit ScpB [Gammaproteobacteria bacterium]|nr:SMC-Scp complex subunit ScpB [Gammaproteobacteria bacterium]